MPGLDPNIILAGSGNIAPPPNILTMSGQVAALQNARAQNLLLQNSNTEFQQKQAAGKIVSNALMQRTDAQGNVDYNGVRGDLAAQGHDNPMIADELSRNLGQQGAQTANDTAIQGLGQAEVANHIAHADLISRTASTLLAQKAPITTSDVTGATANIIGDPALHPDANITGQVASLVAGAPEAPGQQDAYYRQHIGGLALQASDAATRLAAYTGAPTAVNDGAQTNFESINPVAGTVTPLNGPSGKPAVITNRLSPGETASLALQRVQTVDANGTPMSVSALGAAGKPLQTAPSLGQPEAANFGVQRGQAIQEQASNAGPRLAAMQSVRAIINDAPSTAFGPTGHITSQAGKIAAAFGVAPPGVVNGQVSIEEMTKSLNLIAANQAQALGAGTDASRATVANSNPSLANSKAGLLQNLAVVQGNEQWGVAKSRALTIAQQNGLNPAQTRAFETQFNQEISPLVFQIHNMTPQSGQQVFKSLSKPQQQAVTAGRALAQKYGWFDGQ